MSASKGFTLIEVLIVIVILMTMIALVSPLGIQQVERAQARHDLLTIKRLLVNASNLSFSSGESVKITLANQLIRIEKPNTEETIRLEQLSFSQRQILVFNRNGYPDNRVLEYSNSNNKHMLDIFDLLFPSEFEYVYAP